MNEYIKREDVENIMLGSCDESALWKLRRLPPADVETVRHGQLIRERVGISTMAECSECGTHIIGKPNYCPNCGAKMDGKE